MLLVVVSHKGSSPGKQGFKMMVADDGFIFGSIGGGRTEFTLVEKARKLLKTESQLKPMLLNQVHRPDEKDSSGMICAGEQLIVFFPLNTGNIDTVKKIVYEQKGILTISENTFNLSTPEDLNSHFSFLENKKGSWTYKEKISASSHLYIIGGGHVGLATAKLFQSLDFEVTMFDNRKNLNTFEENQYTQNKLILDYQHIEDHIPEGSNTYVVIMTHGHEFDNLIFRKLILKNYRYLGLLGSKAKIKILFKKMISDGFDKSVLQKADAPIGIAINSKTPAEIAVSIAASIISEKNR